MSGIVAQNVGRHSGLVKTVSAGGAWTLIETQTASSDGTLDFTSGLDSTYDEYCFRFINIHGSDNDTNFTFQANVAGESGYNETITSTHFIAYNSEAGSNSFAYDASRDQAQGTAFQALAEGCGSDNDQNLSGELYLYNLSSTTFVKTFMSRVNVARHNDALNDEYGAGYFNTTGAINAIQFKFASGDIDAGTISLYGIG